MNLEAAGMYLRVLREQRALSRSRVAKQIGVNAKSIENWEFGKVDPPSSGLAKLLAVVRGSADDLMALLADQTATETTGREAAVRWLSREQQHDVDAMVVKHGIDRVAEHLARKLRDPATIAEINRALDAEKQRPD
jgi:transcriptional regulator with XRE-family HTH domain